MRPFLSVRGAREHNLRDVDLDLPLGQWVAVVGPSGSGKTSLVFDTLVREGQRRVLGALSARARQFYGKLGRADVDSLRGLPATLAIGQQPGVESARSTVGTITGALDLLRLLFAREAVDPGGEALTRGHFSFNNPLGACEACGGVGLEDRVDPELLLADPARSIRDGALRPTLKNGYTVYSQVTLDVMDRICRAHDFDVDTPWEQLTDAQRDVVLYGTRALKVPFGKHGLESRMKWAGITARPREEGYYRGIVPVIEETLERNRNENVLRYVRSAPCATCAGARLSRPGREARLGGRTLPELAVLGAHALREALDGLPRSPVLAAVAPSLHARLERMQGLGLAHLALARTSASLSGGELQRLRLAAQPSAGLGRRLIALDEPTLGLHPSEQAGMVAVFDALREQGNSLVVVEHDPDMVRHADTLIALGPGAGPRGGRVLEQRELVAGEDGPLGATPPRKATPRPARGRLVLRGARLHNLDDATLDVGLGTLHVVMGPSGAGKSSLVFGTLLPALTGAVECGPYAVLEGAPPGGVQAVDARPLGRTSRSTPATWSGLFDLVRRRFAAEPAAREAGFGPSHFSYNTKGGRCPTCEGLGVRRVGLHLLEDLELTCPECAGGRYAADVLAVRVDGRSIADVLAMTVDEACAFFRDEACLALCRAMQQLGLGDLPLGRPSSRLSRGEGQRVKLATLLGSPAAASSLVLLDEPDRGLHPSDVTQLLAALDTLVDAGHTVVAISHHRQVWAAADELTELRHGVARPVAELDAQALAPVRGARPALPPADAIHLVGVGTHTLRDVDVTIPHGQLTVIAGVSGSGKSSLAFGTLAAEAWRRTAESLPFQVRRFLQRMPAPALVRAEGLGPTLSLRPGQARAGSRSTVATQSELGPLLRVLWSRAGRVDGEPCGLSASHFSRDHALGACRACEGRGVVARCDPARLVSHPERALTAGACDGTRPGRFFTEPDGQHLATLKVALGGDVDLDVPWCELPEAVRDVALHGTGDARHAVRWSFQRGKRSGEHAFEGTWDGLLALVEREAVRRAGSQRAAEWRAPLVDEDCAPCAGSGLGASARAVEVGGLGLAALMALPLADVRAALDAARETALDGAVLDALLPELTERLDDLLALGLGHLQLGRRSTTLSDGELQRTRLAGVLRSGFTGLTLVLDEPEAGLHERDVEQLVRRLRACLAEGNTVVVVSHRPAMLRAADVLLELGPGAGRDGGRLLACGSPEEVLAGDGPTAEALRVGSRRAARPRPGADERPWFVVRGARAHTLRDLDVRLPASGFVCVTGVSGSGKSSLVFDVLAASARSRAPVACDAVDWLPGASSSAAPLEHWARVHSSRVPTEARTVLTALDLLKPLQKLMHGAAGHTTLKPAAFSFLSPAGRCATCKGSGREVVAMDFMADLALPCPACAGARYRPEVLAVRWNGWHVAELLAQPIAEVLAALRAEGQASKVVDALTDGLQRLLDVGLAHLALGRATSELSAGERQRLSLAAGLGATRGPTLHLLDEPATGLHEADLVRLLDVFQRLAARGDLIVAAEHRRTLIDAADWEIELGPEGGAGGGRLLAQGEPGAA